MAAIESGYLQQEMARSTYERYRKIQNGEMVVVGLNRFTSEHELEVLPTRMVPHPYDPKKREEAEERQVAALTQLKRERDNREVARILKEIKEAARKPEVNLIPLFIEGVKAYATLGEICDVLREVFGEYQRPLL